MKVIDNFPHSDFHITLFAWNQKYLIKFERNNLEQIYKISELDVVGVEDIQDIVQNDAFLQKVHERFEQMEADLWEVLNGDVSV